MEKEIQVMN